MADDDKNTGDIITDENPETKKAPPGALINYKYDGLLPISFFCGVISVLISPLPSVLFAYFTGSVFYPFFLTAPLVFWFLTTLFKGCRDVRAYVVMLFFSLVSAYITALTIQAAIYVRVYNMSLLNVPLLTMLTVTKRGVLPTTVSSYVFAVMFTLLGTVIAWDLLYYKERVELRRDKKTSG